MDRFGGWFWFTSDILEKTNRNTRGKWMHFFYDQGFAQNICEKAIEEGVCRECKCSDLETTGRTPGVICFFINGNDVEAHKRVLLFMLENDLIQKTKKGRLYNISFKYNRQTRAGEYGSNYEGTIKLDQFVDLETGVWIHE